MAEGKRLAVDLPIDLHKKLKRIAAEDGQTITEIVKELIVDYVKRKDAEPEEQK